MARPVYLSTALTDKWVAAQEDKYLDESYFTRLIAESADVYKPDGSPLARFRRGVLPLEPCVLAHPVLQRAGRYRNTNRYQMASNVIGYFDRPKCRKTYFTRTQVDQWGQCLPFIRACNQVFRKHEPARYAIQRHHALNTLPDYVIADTAFTTVTVNTWNKDYHAQTPVHKDDGDLPEGFGVISVLSSGNYSGGYLMFPQYQIAFDLHTTDVLLCDVHEWHCNAPIVGEVGWERIACILYYRTRMRRLCGMAGASE